jgi:hypothetical protein
MKYIAIFTLLLSTISFCQWSNNPLLNNAICTADNDQASPQVISDGIGGAIFMWQDYRNGLDNDIYAQHFDAAGFAQWDSNGIAITTADNHQWYPRIADDGTGGAIIVWEDLRNYPDKDIYAQRIDANGTVKWTTDGVPVCTATDIQLNPRIVSDGVGGAIIAWEDLRTSILDIYAQRIDANGNFLWTSNGVRVCVEIHQQWIGEMLSTGNGAIIVWTDNRHGYGFDIYAQNLDLDGVMKKGWTENGSAITYLEGGKQYPVLVSDGSGGAIIVWQDYRNGSDFDIYSQRINSAGIIQWTENGVAISTAEYGQHVPQAVSDGDSSAIIVWHDQRNGYFDIYSQKINSNGSAEWTANGVPVCTEAYDQTFLAACSDGKGGIVITWQDYRNGYGLADIYAQRLNGNGVAQWVLTGAKVSAANDDQIYPRIIATENDGFVLTWTDERHFAYDIYAQRLNSDGSLGGPNGVKEEEDNYPPVRFELFQNFPNPFNPKTSIGFRIYENSFVSLKIFDVFGGEVAALVNEEKQAGKYQIEFNAVHLASGVYFYKLQTGGLEETKKLLLIK